MTQGLLKSRETKNRLHKQCLINPCPLTCNTYKQFRNLYQRTIRAAKKLHIVKNLSDCKGNPKRTWQILNECTGRIAKNSKIEKIRSNGIITENQQQIAEEFNNFFTK